MAVMVCLSSYTLYVMFSYFQNNISICILNSYKTVTIIISFFSNLSVKKSYDFV